MTPPSVLEPQFVGLRACDEVARGGQTWRVKPLKRSIDQLINTIDRQRLTLGGVATFGVGVASLGWRQRSPIKDSPGSGGSPFSVGVASLGWRWTHLIGREGLVGWI